MKNIIELIKVREAVLLIEIVFLVYMANEQKLFDGILNFLHVEYDSYLGIALVGVGLCVSTLVLYWVTKYEAATTSRPLDEREEQHDQIVDQAAYYLLIIGLGTYIFLFPDVILIVILVLTLVVRLGVRMYMEKYG
jgi:hypothetical protein